MNRERHRRLESAGGIGHLDPWAGHVKRAVVEPASKPKAEYHDWDSRYPKVVAALVSEMEPLPSFLKIEHIGSTAVPNCGGKGILDLLALYESGQLDATRNFLHGLGFGSQGREFTRAWPAERPMLLGLFHWAETAS